MASSTAVDIAFCKILPKAELHAHLSGSIKSATLHEIWKNKHAQGQCLDLEDPSKVIDTGHDRFVDVVSFFPLFDKYIYNLCNDLESVQYAMERVIEDFQADGVQYLELRTTPRECVDTGMSKEQYVHLVNEVARMWNLTHGTNMEVYIILSIDRSMSLQQATQVLDLAFKHQRRDHDSEGQIVGIDLCGNPCKGNVEIFTPVFKKANDMGLGITAHFAEVRQSATDHELDTILSWNPHRLGHCIHVVTEFQNIIQSRHIGLELCLSCNVLAKLTLHGFENHHFREWLARDCPIALSTDDVGVFGSPLSNEYMTAAKTFNLSKTDLVELSKSAVCVAFAGRDRMRTLLDAFEKDMAKVQSD
jgi:adenosine deaminase